MIIRDLHTWVRLEFLGVMARSGVAGALAEPRTIDDVADRTGIVDRELLAALLDLGVSLRELRVRRGRYSVRGRRMRAIVGASPDLRGVVEELVVYDNAVYAALDSHLRGAPPGRIRRRGRRRDRRGLADRRTVPRADGPRGRPPGAAVAGPRHRLRERRLPPPRPRGRAGCDRPGDRPRRRRPTCRIRAAGARLRAEARCELRQGDIEDLAAELGRFDLVTLLNNIYYWPPEARAGVLRTVGVTVAPGGTILLATAARPRAGVQPAPRRHAACHVEQPSAAHRRGTRDRPAGCRLRRRRRDRAGAEERPARGNGPAAVDRGPRVRC